MRSQVLTMRERAYVEVARLNGLNNLEIIFKELIPNLLPYLAASFVGAVSSAVLAAIGLEALGLGPQSEPTLGMTIYWARYYNGLPRDVVVVGAAGADHYSAFHRPLYDRCRSR
ncbi:MAG: ABC transporter permease subunit [Caldilineaceae bacterium]